MILNLVIAIVAVAAATGAFTGAMVWWVQSSTSEDAQVRRHAWLVEVLMSSGVIAISAPLSKSPTERKLTFATVGVLIAVWLFRSARYLIARRKA